jgi:cytochrome oxidase Cu insertion factor (SCO1/SenC/PrrC family)
VIASQDGDAWALGAPADERNAALEGLQAPDFTLQDVDGKPRTLSELRGKKVFLATWASW